MSIQAEKLVADEEPQSVEHAKQMIAVLEDEIASIKDQINDLGRRDSMGDKTWKIWRSKAETALRHKKLRLHRLHQSVSKKPTIKPVAGSSREIGQALKLASKHYGVLMGVLIAAEDYINSPNDDKDDILFGVLEQSIIKARELIVS